MRSFLIQSGRKWHHLQPMRLLRKTSKKVISMRIFELLSPSISSMRKYDETDAQWKNYISSQNLFTLSQITITTQRVKKSEYWNILLPSLNKIYHICIQDWNKSITTLSTVFYLLIVIGKQLPSYRQVSEKSDTQFFLFYFHLEKR